MFVNEMKMIALTFCSQQSFRERIAIEKLRRRDLLTEWNSPYEYRC